jgi:hypothetical protein
VTAFLLLHQSEMFRWSAESFGCFVSLQYVLKDLIAEKLPRLASHLAYYSVDISLVTFNWFLCIFIDSLPVDLFLQVWDAFLFEGSKVCVASQWMFLALG